MQQISLPISTRTWDLYAKYIAIEDIKRVTTLCPELDNNRLDQTIINNKENNNAQNS